MPHAEKVERTLQHQGLKHKGMVMPVHVRMHNPLVIGGKHHTVVLAKDVDRLIGAMQHVAKKNDSMARYNPGRFKAMKEHAEEQGGLTGRDIVDWAHNHIFYDDQNEDGNNLSGEHLRQSLERAGFDGVIDHDPYQRWGRHGMEMDPNTTHVVAFKPNQIKSALGNRGTFDASQPDITKEEGGFVDDRQPHADGGAVDTQAAAEVPEADPVTNPAGYHSAAAQIA